MLQQIPDRHFEFGRHRAVQQPVFGLVGAKKPVGLTAPSLVLPDVWPVELTVSERRSPDMDSSEYSMYHPGNDPSETFALREYLPGDRIKNIHWKLSEKTDHLLVRQLGLPVNNAILLVLDNTADTAPSPEEREALGEAAVSVSAALCEAGLPHQAAWLDRETTPEKMLAGARPRRTHILCGGASCGCLVLSRADHLSRLFLRGHLIKIMFNVSTSNFLIRELQCNYYLIRM